MANATMGTALPLSRRYMEVALPTERSLDNRARAEVIPAVGVIATQKVRSLSADKRRLRAVGEPLRHMRVTRPSDLIDPDRPTITCTSGTKIGTSK